MGQKSSKEKLLYDRVIRGDVQGIHALSKQGAGLEWKDKKGRTPLTVAAKDPRLYAVATTLVELGANVNAFCKERPGGTPLHYAAKEGLDQTVALLLVNGASAMVKSRDHQTPIDVARKKGRNTIVRQIESHICYFAGYIRETCGPGFSDASAPQLSSRVIWAVIVPRSAHNPPKTPKLELVIYSTFQDAEPRKVVSLSKSKIKEPKFDQLDPSLTIINKSTKTRYKFSSVTEDDKQQLRRLYNACKGICQVTPGSPLKALSMAANTSPLLSPSTETRNELGYTYASLNAGGRGTPVQLSPRVEYNNIWGSAAGSPHIHQTANFQYPPAVPVSSPTAPSAPPVSDVY